MTFEEKLLNLLMEVEDGRVFPSDAYMQIIHLHQEECKMWWWNNGHRADKVKSKRSK